MPEYTLLAVASVIVTVVIERRLAVGLFRRLQYWIAIAIVFAFQVPVDGWLTKLTAPIVVYAPAEHLGVRWPWDIPVEDFLFGFSMVTLALILWVRRLGRSPDAPSDETRGQAKPRRSPSPNPSPERRAP